MLKATDKKNRPPTRPWSPPKDGSIRTHAGEKIDSKGDFFAAPPPDIGTVRSAYTTLHKTKRPRPLIVQIAIGAGITALGAGLGLVVNWVFSIHTGFWMYFWPAAGASIGLLGGSTMATFAHFCSYVGTKGMVKIACSGRRKNTRWAYRFLFSTASELRTNVAEHYMNNVYQRTDYRFTWTDAQGRRQCLISGSHTSEDNHPPADDDFHLARAAERSWTMYLLEKTAPLLDEDGYVQFNLHGKDHLRVGSGFLEVYQKGKRHRCHTDDIAELSLVGGTFILKRKDARIGWLRRSGVYAFEYSDLANASLFLILLERLVGFGL